MTPFIERLVVNRVARAVHGIADHWIQTSPQAQGKGEPGPEGRRCCNGHCASYTITLAITHAAAAKLAGQRLNPWTWALGHVGTYLLHYVMDRSRDSGTFVDHYDEVLRKLETATAGAIKVSGKRTYWDHGGRYDLDQAWHEFCLELWAWADAWLQSSRDGKKRW